jgi:C4-dicarboxylate-binding protein DctP
MKRVLFFVALMFTVIALATPALCADDVYKLKLSVETNMNHHRNKALKLFKEMLEKNTNNRIKVQFFHSAQLYKDKDIPKAMKLGTVHMAVPGIWQLEGVDQNTAITALPMFYGLPTGVTRRLMDGEVGELLTETLQKKMDVVVPGKWYDHGYVHVCPKTKAIKKLEDFKGMKIRHPGGAANSLRLKALGASPVMIPWPDLPMAMVQGTADGFLTTFKSFDSAKLWETGVKNATADKQYYMQYVPMINGKYWRNLPKDLQKIFLDTWEQHMPQQRTISANEQTLGEKNMKKHGVIIEYPSDQTLAKWREQTMTVQDQIVEELGMDKEFVARVKNAVDKAMK